MHDESEPGDDSRTEQAKRGIDPSDLEPGDEVHVLQDGEPVATGTVEDVDADAEPAIVTVEDEDGDGWAWFDAPGRSFARADEDDALDVEEALGLLEEAVGTITDNVASGRLYGETVEESRENVQELQAAFDTIEAALADEGRGAE